MKQNYLNMLCSINTIKMVQKNHGIDMPNDESVVMVKDALKAVNDYNIGKYHPDIEVSTPDHFQVVVGNEIVGFIAREELS